MCGIIHCKSLEGKKICKSIRKRYETQKTRGKEGFGFLELKGGFVTGIQRSENEKEILEMLSKSEADEILFHHRFPTSTPNFVEATHPILVSNNSLRFDYYLVHNGIISNDDELKKIHNEKGFEYTTEVQKQYATKGNLYVYDKQFNDSEALAIDFALSIENDKAMETRGSIAFVAIQVDKETKKAISLFWGRNIGNPLKIEDYHTFFSLSSETGAEILSNELYCMDYDTQVVTKIDKVIGTYYTPYKYTPTHDYRGNMGFRFPNDNDDDTDLLRLPVVKKQEDEEYTNMMDDEAEEDDYILDLKLEILELETQMYKALGLNDYDKATELEAEIEGLKADLLYKTVYEDTTI